MEVLIQKLEYKQYFVLIAKTIEIRRVLRYNNRVKNLIGIEVISSVKNYNLDSLFNYAELTKDIDASLVMRPEIENQKDFSKSFILEKEKEVFGFYLSSHPTTVYKKDNPYCIPLNTVDKNFSKKIDTLILVDKIKSITTKNIIFAPEFLRESGC